MNNPFLRGHPRYDQEQRQRRNGNQQRNGNQEQNENILMNHPLVRGIQNGMDEMLFNINFQAPVSWRTEAVYLVTFAHVVQIIMNFFGDLEHRYVEMSIIQFIGGIFQGEILIGRLFTPIIQMLSIFFGYTSNMVWSFSSLFAVLFMLGNYLGFRYFFRNGLRNVRNRRYGGTKRKGGNSKKKISSKKTQSKKFMDTMSNLDDLSTKTEIHFSGKVKVSNSKEDQKIQNEMVSFIKKYVTQVNANKYKISLSGLDLIISIQDGKVTFGTVFSDREKFNNISKEIFQKYKSVYAKYGVTEEDIHSKIDQLSNEEFKFDLSN
jgi:hypothetical protein